MRVALFAVMLSAVVFVLEPARASAQACGCARGELIDPFETTLATQLGPIREMASEILDPFADLPASSSTGSSRPAEILDPFRGVASFVSEILDPWAS